METIRGTSAKYDLKPMKFGKTDRLPNGVQKPRANELSDLAKFRTDLKPEKHQLQIPKLQKIENVIKPKSTLGKICGKIGGNVANFLKMFRR